MTAKKHKNMYDQRRGKVLRRNSKHVVVKILNGPAKDTKRKALFDTVEIVELARCDKKQKTTESEPERQSDSEDDASPAGQPDKDVTDGASRAVFGDLALYG